MEQSKKVQFLATFAVALSSMTASVSYSWTTPVIPKFHNNETDVTLTDTEISWMVSVISPGVMVGSLVSRLTSDRFGRRTTLLGTALPFTVGTIFAVTATKAWQLWLARFSWGLGNGVISAVAMVYISEIAAKEIRGKLSTINRYMFTFGAFLVITVGSVATYQGLSYMLVALSILFFGACLWAPETPYFLIKEGKIAAARKALMRLNGYRDEKVLEEKLEDMRSHVREEMKNAGTIKELLTGKQYRRAILICVGPCLVLEEKLEDMRSHVREEMKNAGTIKELLTGKQYRRAILICVGLKVTQVMAGSIPLQQYLGRILQETNSDISVSTGLIMYGAMRFTMSIVSSFLVDKLGRRPLLIFSYLGASLILASLGTVFFFHEVLNKTPNYFGYITLFSLMFFTTVVNLGFETVNFVISAEMFPLNVKSTAMTCLSILVSATTFVNLRGYQIIKDFSGMCGILWFFACFALSGAVFSYVVVPETKGKSLREIQIEVQGAYYDEANEELKKDKKQIDLQEVKSTENIDKTISLKV